MIMPSVNLVVGGGACRYGQDLTHKSMNKQSFRELVAGWLAGSKHIFCYCSKWLTQIVHPATVIV